MMPPDAGQVFVTACQGPPYPLTPLLDRAGLPELLSGVDRILIKPNLVEALPPPITTPPALVGALIDYLHRASPAEIIIGEGAGASSYDTMHCFAELGYEKLARDKDIRLIDLNGEPWVERSLADASRWPTMHLPGIAYESFLLSVPVLKAHSLAGVTLTMKNMMGLPPPAFYQEGGSWKKSRFHRGMQDAIRDLNLYRHADFTLLDATVGMAQAHLWGPTCSPPVALLCAACDPVAIDAYGCSLLGKDWRDIDHIRDLHGKLGCGSPLQIITVEHTA